MSASQTTYMTMSTLPDELRHGLASGEPESFQYIMATISNDDQLIAVLPTTEFEEDEMERIEKSLREVGSCLIHEFPD